MHRNRTWLLDPIELRTQRNRILPIEGGDGSTLSLDFTTGVLDPRLTFTRSTNATFINSSGLVQWAANNMVIRSQDYTNSAWSKLRIDTTSSGLNVANTTIAPDGSNTGLLLKADAAAGSHRVLQSNNTTGSTFLSNNGFTIITLSAFFKANGSNFAALKISNNIESRGVTRTFNLTNGVVSGIEDATWVCTNASATSVGNGWYRCQITASISRVDANDDQFGMWLFVANGADSADRSFTNSSASVWAWGAQAELASSAGGYNATTTATYQAPRFDHDPNTGSPRGLLIEGSANNLARYSETFETTGGWWGYNAATRTVESSDVNPTGATGSISFGPTTNGGSRYCGLFLTGQTTTVGYTYSVWVKAKGTSSLVVTIQNNAGAVNSNARIISQPSGATASFAGSGGGFPQINNLSSTGWTKIELTTTGTLGGTGTLNVFMYPNNTATQTTADTVFAWGAQLEAGSGASSYIPTGASTGNRATDSLVIQEGAWRNTANIDSTWYVDGVLNKMNTAFNPVFLFVGNAGYTEQNRVFISATGSQVRFTHYARSASVNPDFEYAINQASPNGYVYGSRFKVAATFDNTAGENRSSWNGATSNGTTAAACTTTPTYFTITVGSGNDWHFRSIKYWPLSLPQTTLNGITTL